MKAINENIRKTFPLANYIENDELHEGFDKIELTSYMYILIDLVEECWVLCVIKHGFIHSTIAYCTNLETAIHKAEKEVVEKQNICLN